MGSRERERVAETECKGSYFYLYGNPQTTWLTKMHTVAELCQDTVGQRETVNGLYLCRETRQIGTVWREYWQGDVMLLELNNYPIAYTPAPADPSVMYPNPSDLDKSNYCWDIYARTNPSVPHVSIPTFIGELKDVPSLVKDWGGSLLKKVAKGYLSWRWAIAPMIRDVRAMCSFQKAVDDRFRWLRRLRDTEFLSRRCGLGQSVDEDPAETGLYLHSQGGLVAGCRDISYTEKVWGSAQWKLDSNAVLPASNLELYDTAMKLTFGITSFEALATAWELLPWSWFIDWFTGVGRVIDASNNSVQCTASKACLMRTLTSRSSYRIMTGPPTTAGTVVKGPYYEEEVQKLRYPVATSYPFQLTSLPLVEGDKWSILGALAVLKFAR